MTQFIPSLDPDFLMFEFHSGLNSIEVPQGQKTENNWSQKLLRKTNSLLETLTSRSNDHNTEAMDLVNDMIWCHSTTLNQREMLNPVMQCLNGYAIDWDLYEPNSSWLSMTGTALSPANQEARSRWPDCSNRTLLEIYAFTLAETRALCDLLSARRPACILSCNDHSPRHMALRYAAWETNTKLYYLQHAAVGGLEPPLEGFTGVFLHGAHAAAKYSYEDAELLPQHIHLVGSPKLDSLTPPTVEHSRSTVGICPGLNAELSWTTRVLQCVRDAIPSDFKISHRLHPRFEKTEPWLKLLEEYGAMPGKERASTTDFLKDCALIVSDDSNIALEAPAMGSRVIRTFFGQGFSDQYGVSTLPFFQDCTVSLEHLFNKIRRIDVDQTMADLRQVAQFFYANIDTDWAGNSAGLVAKTLLDQVPARAA